MSKTTREILVGARELLQDPAKWTQGANAKNANGEAVPAHNEAATCFCFDGALIRLSGSASEVANGRSNYASAFALAQRVLIDFAGHHVSPIQVNDGKQQIGELTPHEAVLKILDLAIEEAS